MNLRHTHGEHQPPSGELLNLSRAGFSLVPLGRGKGGKAPLLKFKSTHILPLNQVLATMHRASSACYGVRLDGLVVIDIDSDDPDLVTLMEARFGVSSVHVKSPRGSHLYYRADDIRAPNLRAEDLPVDIKRGGSSYVVGPHSVRPDGGIYEPVKGDLAATPLTAFRVEVQETSEIAPSASRKTAQDGKISEGGRHQALVKAAIANVEQVADAAELFDILRTMRDRNCENPTTFSDSEVIKISEWAWSCRLQNRVYKNRDGEVKVSRKVLGALRDMANVSDATALYVMLVDRHGHVAGKTFALVHEAMREAGLTDLSRRRFLAARRSLEEIGVLEIAAGYRPGTARQEYRLVRRCDCPVNVVGLQRRQQPEKK